MTTRSALQATSDRLLDWLLNSALPVWWRAGADHVQGGFFEALSTGGAPVLSGRRARVQARQVYSYAVGGRLGWTGPWREAALHALGYFLTHYRRSDGLFRTMVHADGSPADDRAFFYDQAFALLALAEGRRAFPDRADLATMAHSTFEALRLIALPSRGYRETSDTLPGQSNPHMHLLEAALAWEEIEPHGPWAKAADAIVALCLDRFIDAQGALHEFFAEDWSPAPDVDGRIVEPGHQFEWAWLLERWARLRGDPIAARAARRLYAIGAGHGIDSRRGVAIDQLLDDFSVHQANARLWPQTERLKACLIFWEAETDPEAKKTLQESAVAAARGLELYLDKPEAGLWRDKLQKDGTFVVEPAPASSLYHIVCAVAELRRLTPS